MFLNLHHFLDLIYLHLLFTCYPQYFLLPMRFNFHCHFIHYLRLSRHFHYFLLFQNFIMFTLMFFLPHLFLYRLHFIFLIHWVQLMSFLLIQLHFLHQYFRCFLRTIFMHLPLRSRSRLQECLWKNYLYRCLFLIMTLHHLFHPYHLRSHSLMFPL